MSDTMYVLINWTDGTVVGTSETETECRDQADKAARNEKYYQDTFMVCRVIARSEAKRVWSPTLIEHI